MIRMYQLRKRVRKVEREIQELGLWFPEMEDTQVYLTPFHLWYGWTTYPSGDIFIPRITTSRWIDSVPWSLRDILRHEYGHVFAWHKPKVLRKWPRCTDRVSDYAQTDKAEDFAETFRCFLKHRGKLPSSWQENPGITRRWRKIEKAANKG